MRSKANKTFIVLTISLSLCLNISKGFYLKPGFEDVRRYKRGHTTVCVEIKPNGSGTQEPYYMCKGPEFPHRQQNVAPPQFFKTNAGSYPPTMSVGIKTNGENYHHYEPPQNQQFGNVYQQPQQQLNADNHAHFANANQQTFQAPGMVKTNGQNYQLFEPAQNVQFGNGQPPSPQSQHEPAVIKAQEENHYQYAQHHMSSQMHDYSPNSNMANHQYHPGATPLIAPDFPTIPKSPTEASTSNLQNNYENIPQPTKTTATQPFENQNSRSDILRVERNESNLNKLPLLALNEAVNHKINSEHFKALIEDEVVGSPNLDFSHDEMLPIHNMYSDSKLDDRMRLPMEDSLIPPEYLDDPILRTFYNIDDNSNKYQEKPYYSPLLNQAAVENVNDCFDSSAPLVAPTSYMDGFKHPPPNSNSCCDCPFPFQPILIAIPWFSSPYQELFTHMRPPACGYLPAKSNEGYSSPYSTPARSRANEDSSSSTEDLSNKKPATLTEIKTETTQPPTITTKTPKSSEEEEDLFAEDTTAKNDKITKNGEEDSQEETDADKGKQEEDEVKASTTSVPFTTVRTFKTMMHAAKMHSMLASGRGNPLQQLPNKRQVHYMTAPVFPHNFKRQYVRNLEKMHN